MFKRKRIVANIYKKETNWSAVIAVAFWVIVGLAVLGSLGG